QRKQQKQNEFVFAREHCVEMRGHPPLVHGVAREAPTEMVVDSSLAHAFKRVFDGLEKARISRAQAGAPKHLEDGGLRKLWGATQPTINLVEHVADLDGG